MFTGILYIGINTSESLGLEKTTIKPTLCTLTMATATDTIVRGQRMLV